MFSDTAHSGFHDNRVKKSLTELEYFGFAMDVTCFHCKNHKNKKYKYVFSVKIICLRAHLPKLTNKNTFLK